MIIQFPEELVAINPDLNQEYIYEFPAVIQKEVYEFNLPLETRAGNYTIEIEAWKKWTKVNREVETCHKDKRKC